MSDRLGKTHDSEMLLSVHVCIYESDPWLYMSSVNFFMSIGARLIIERVFLYDFTCLDCGSAASVVIGLRDALGKAKRFGSAACTFCQAFDGGVCSKQD